MRLPPTSVRRFLLVATALLLVLVGPTAAAAQEVPPTTVGDVLVPGAPGSTTVAPPTTAAPATSAPAGGAADDGGGLLDLDLDANQKVWVIVGGLVVVAILIAVLTVVYWRHTKPDPTRGPRRSRRDERRQRRADRRDPFDEARPDEGPLDVDALLGQPEPSRSVFAAGPDDPPGPAR